MTDEGQPIRTDDPRAKGSGKYIVLTDLRFTTDLGTSSFPHVQARDARIAFQSKRRKSKQETFLQARYEIVINAA